VAQRYTVAEVLSSCSSDGVQPCCAPPVRCQNGPLATTTSDRAFIITEQQDIEKLRSQLTALATELVGLQQRSRQGSDRDPAGGPLRVLALRQHLRRQAPDQLRHLHHLLRQTCPTLMADGGNAAAGRLRLLPQQHHDPEDGHRAQAARGDPRSERSGAGALNATGKNRGQSSHAEGFFMSDCPPFLPQLPAPSAIRFRDQECSGPQRCSAMKLRSHSSLLATGQRHHEETWPPPRQRACKPWRVSSPPQQPVTRLILFAENAIPTAISTHHIVEILAGPEGHPLPVATGHVPRGTLQIRSCPAPLTSSGSCQPAATQHTANAQRILPLLSILTQSLPAAVVLPQQPAVAEAATRSGAH